MESIIILEINVNNQLRYAYGSDSKENLFKQIEQFKDYDDEYYIIYHYVLNNSIQILFENKNISKIKHFLLENN